MRSEIVPLAMLHAKAREVRLAFECNAFDTELARRAYGAYAPDIDLDLFLDRARGLFPALNCGLCSTYLAAVLGCGVIRRGKYGNMGHTVLMVGGLIVDTTADQFGGLASRIRLVHGPGLLRAFGKLREVARAFDQQPAQKNLSLPQPEAKDRKRLVEDDMQPAVTACPGCPVFSAKQPLLTGVNPAAGALDRSHVVGET